MTRKQKKVVFLGMIIIGILLAVVIMQYGRGALGTFRIISFQQDLKNTDVADRLIFQSSKGATHYQVIFKDDTGRVVKEVGTRQNEVEVANLNCLPKTKVTVTITAYDEQGNSKRSRNKYQFIYEYKEGVTPVVVYLSPSNQDDNIGVSRAGYTTEGEIMNKIGDVVERELRKKSIVLYRGNPDNTLNTTLAESKKVKPDLHIALHSNAVGTGEQNTARGIETWIYNEQQKIQPLAQQLQNALMRIYNNPAGDRGIRYSSTERSMRELEPSRTDNAILIEIGFHDNYQDALWIVQNIEKIGQTLANTIINYFSK